MRCAEGLLSLVIEQPTPDVRVVWVTGELDLLTTPLLEANVHSCIETGPRHVVVDLGRVSFLGVSGLGCLVTAQQTATGRDVRLHLTGADHRVVARPLEITGLRPSFDIHPTVDRLCCCCARREMS
jgi:anti-anti-sigma factor